MPQKKEKKKVIKKVIKNTKPKPKPTLKDSINVKVGLQDMLKLTCAGCAEEKKKKPRRKKRQAQTKEITDNNVSYVDSSGQPISNEIINNRSFSRSYIPQPFSRNSSIVGTSFNETSIMDKVIEKMSKLNATNQSMNNSVLNQSTAAPAPPRPAPARTQALSTIAPASPSIAPQSLNFNLSSPVRSLGMTPLQASSLAINPVQQYAMASKKAAINTQEAIAKLFQHVSDMEQAEIKRATDYVRTEKYTELMKAPIGGARAARFKTASNLCSLNKRSSAGISSMSNFTKENPFTPSRRLRRNSFSLTS